MTEICCNTVVHYERMGETGSPMVLLHGWGCDLGHMRPVAEALKEDHRVLLLDFPGHGESGRPPEPWGVPEYAACLRELLSRLSFTPCAAVAHSFGCRVAVYLASEEPALFTKLVLTGAAGIRPKPSEEARKRSARYQKLKGYAESAKHIPGLGHAAERWEEKLRQQYGSRDYNALDAEMRQTFVRVINLDLSDRYPSLRQSTLLLWGDADTETPLWMGREMEKMIPDAGLVLLEGGSHFAYLEQIGRFNTIVRHFLKEG